MTEEEKENLYNQIIAKDDELQETELAGRVPSGTLFDLFLLGNQLLAKVFIVYNGLRVIDSPLLATVEGRHYGKCKKCGAPLYTDGVCENPECDYKADTL